MGKLIRLWERMDAPRRRSGGSRSGTTATAAELSFDLRCPYSYLAAEQLERAFDELIWTPASWTALHPVGACRDGGADAYRRAAEARAAALRLPLVWPERWPAGVPAAMRVAAFARERGRGGPFVLAAMRLAFCGGFDLDDPETLAEAAAASRLPLDACFAAARNTRRDRRIERAGRHLAALGADRLPALRVGGAVDWGEARVAGLVDGVRSDRRARR